MPDTNPSDSVNSSPADPPDVHRLEADRRANRDAIAALGVSPYGGRVAGLATLAQAARQYDPDADAHHRAHSKDDVYTDRRPALHVAGRVMLHRDNGKLVWINLRDSTGDLQIAVSKRDCDDPGFALAKKCDLGDLVTAQGPLVKTRTGEITIWATSFTLASKSIAPPPEKWSGLADPELRYRKRYIDLYANPDVMRTFQRRSAIVSRIRRFWDERDFLEVETPILQPQPGGAAARPFHSHLNAMDMPITMRIATELHLKRLLVGGMGRVYELGRIFRNEGIDRQHNPEFTSIEVYEAFGDNRSMLDHTEALLRTLAHFIAASNADAEPQDIDPAGVHLPFGEHSIDFGSPFAQITYADLFERALGFPMSDAARAREDAAVRHLKHEGMDDVFVINELFEAIAEPTIDPCRPTFILDYPAAISPLTRPLPDNPALAGRWDLFIGGMEIGTAYTELNDPDVQIEKFRQQLAGADEEEQAYRTFDADFIEALKVAMPPAGGLGLGIDRIVMLLTNQQSIRDVILFPFMRPV